VTARKLIGVLAFGLALAPPPAASAQFGRAGSDQRYVPGEAIVRFEPGVAAAERREARAGAGVSFEQSLGLRRTQVVAFDGPVRAAVDRLEDQPGVAYAQPNYRYHALAPVPNDTYFEDATPTLWGLSGAPASVDVLPAWDRSRGAGQVIAIVDTGVDMTHSDLAANLWTGPGGIHGMDFVDDDTDPDDFNLHGTHVAGIAAAIADNGVGVAGVAPQAQIMAVRVLDGDGSGTSDTIVDGIDFAAANGADVINMSLGGPPDAGDPAMESAVAQAGQANVVVVVAAGNDDEDNDEFPTTPCTFGNSNLLCVAAVTRTGARSSFSNFGRTTVDLGAPGGDLSGDPTRDVLSTKPLWAPVFSEDFDGGLDAWTASHTSGAADWGIEPGAGIGGSDAATDSPGGNYLPGTKSQLETNDPVGLSGRRGCRLQYALGLAGLDDPDDVAGVGVFSGAGDIGQDFNGDSGGYELIEQSISAVDGRNDVTPTFLFDSDADLNVGDGAYVDSFNVLCRAGAPYDDQIGSDDALGGHSYTAIAGTSMAAPHAAGAAALVRAVDPGAPPEQVVEALRQGARPDFGMQGVTVTGGVVDASGAMDAALAIPNTQPPPPPPPPPAATPPSRPRFGKARVNRRGVVSVVVRSDPATTGVLTLSANITAARVRRVGRKAFRVGAGRRATVRVRLGRRARRQLRRRHALRLRMRAVVRNGAGLSSSRTARIRIRQPRRR
jgi:subtilisin family serine protease